MKKYVIFGAANLGRVLATELSHCGEIVGFLDNNPEKWGTKVDNIRVLGNAAVLKDFEYDEIVIASTMHFDAIKKSIIEYGVPEEKFNKEIINRLTTEIQARVNFLRDYASLHVNAEKEACVAEGGVYQGMFAREINKFFPERKLYLFDTFEGFDNRDVQVELVKGLSDVKEKYYGETSVEIVMNGLPHKEQAVICKGYFPDTTKNIPDEKYVFVNLDFDLYTPILAGLEYFYPRMIDGGVILVHDYFTKYYHGVAKAVQEFEQEHALIKTPIGDGISIALYKQKKR